MYPYRPGRVPVRMPVQRPMNSPFMRGPMHHPYMQSRGGGLLSRIFNKGNPASPFQGMPTRGFPPGGMFGPGINSGVGSTPFLNGGTAGFGNLLSNFTSGGLPNMLNNVQKVMGIAQQVAPMVQQYGPLIKNMPAMLKIMKELNNTDSTDENNELSDLDDIDLELTVEKDIPSFNETETQKNPPNIYTSKQSKPKLYI